MKKYLFIISFFAMVNSFQLAAQDNTVVPEFKTAIEYNDYIINEQIKVTNAMSELVIGVEANAVADFDKYYSNQLDITKSALETIKKLGPYNGNSEFRNAARKLFNFYYKTTKNKIVVLIKILKKPKITAKESRKLEKINAQIEKKEKILDAAFVLAQQKFAKKNNFTIGK